MAAQRKKDHSESRPQRPPATTPEARENQMISLAFQLAEKQLVAGTASSQVITHYLKLGSSREKLEQAKLDKEHELLEAKADAIASAKRVEELYKEALSAMRSYSGNPIIEDDYDDD